MRFILIIVLLLLTGGGMFATLQLWPLPEEVSISQIPGDAKRGAYLARLSGCVACHTSKEGPPLAGGVPLRSDFGTFYSPNITPDLENGIGRWTLAQFTRAVRQGVSPEGHSYYPSFPFEFYGAMPDGDINDIWAALKNVPASATPSIEHDTGFPVTIREGLKVWRTFFAQPYVYEPDPSRSESWNRGKYMVEGPAHCAACHTPRNVFGGMDPNAVLAGNPTMLDGGKSPSITAEDLIKQGWSVETLAGALRTGVTPDGDVFGGSMAKVVRDGTSYLLTEHLRDMALYLLDKDE